MKNILLLAHDDIGQEARFQAALDVTRAVNGHLKCLDVLSLCISPIDVAEGSSLVLDFARKAEVENKKRLLERLNSEDVSWEWDDRCGFIASALTDAADLADLIVVNRRLDEYPIPDMDRVVGEVLVKSNTPVLAVPADSHGFQAAGPALVAWDGSSPAAAALTAAVPLLKLASSVIILEIEDGSIESPAEEAAFYLSRHDVHPEIVQEKTYNKKASDLVLAHANSGRFTYLVMGGFGHLRLVEALFGGVTQSVLNHSPIPVFLAH